MARYRLLLRCIGEAVALHGPRALLGLVPFGEHLFDIARDAHARYRQQCPMPEAVARVEAAAQAPVAEVQAEARAVVAEIRAAADPGEAARLADPQLERALVAYLTQVPAAIRASLRRPADPAGRSVPAGFSVQQPEEFLRLLPARPPRFQSGDTVVNGQWQLEELLGVGGFGEVWKARPAADPKGPPAALKFCLDPEAARYLRNEARLMDRVKQEAQGPGIVQLRQVYLEHDPPCLAYEFVNGGDVTGLMHDWLRLSLEKRVPLAARVVHKLARIMTPLHRMDPPIVHRDLKPANLLVARKEGKRFDLKIADLGISGQAARQAVAAATRGVSRGDLLSQSLRGSHTPLYASPEQMRGGPPDPRDDVHALGVIWYQLLTCDLQRAVGVDFEEDLRELNVPGDTAALIRRCVARADRRFADAGELAEAIAALAPVEEEAPPPRPRWRPSKQLVLAGACVVGLLVLAGLGFWLARRSANVRPGDAPATADARSGGSQRSEKQDPEPPRPTPPSPVTGKDEPKPPPPLLTGKVAAGTKAGEVTRVTIAPGVEMTFAWCPPGTFVMGSPPDEEGRSGDETQHKVTLTQGYWLGVHEVTQKQWQTVLGNNPSRDEGDDFAVETVSWDDCQAFCTKLGEKTGKRFRLPTEAEWEYACRAGTTTAFHTGNDHTDLLRAGWTSRNAGGRSSPVRRKEANAWGLYDMHGNVWEWVAEWYGDYPAGDVKDPQGPASGERRILRGGSRHGVPTTYRSAYRYRVDPAYCTYGTGCRVVLCIDSPAAPAGANKPVPSTGKVSAGTKAGELTRVMIAPGVEMTFAWCPPGTFQMGSPKDDKEWTPFDNQHRVTLTQGYWLGVHEVTQKQWQAVMGDNPSNFKGDHLPVEQVSWDDCQTFCTKLGEKTGRRFRLPSEAEWEYACRAGTTTPFHFGDTISTDQANYEGFFTYGRGVKGQSRNKTTSVGSFPANAWGLHDLHGNVEEWCQDRSEAYPSGDVADPQGPATGDRRVMRGGSWSSQPAHCRSAFRNGVVPGHRRREVGCRVVLCVDAPAAADSGKPVPSTGKVSAGTKAGEQTRVLIVPGVEMTFAWCPPGSFLMGTPPDEEGRQEDETQHKVTLTQGYWLGIHEVTQKQWQAVMGTNPSSFKGDDQPVEEVTWDDCQAFCTKLGEKTGKRFRLPTEAEWEYACRAGTITPFHFGDTISTDQANYLGSPAYGRGRTGTNRRATTPVGTFPANAWGLHDLHGNVWEWCQDWYGDYPAGDVKDPRGPASGGSRVSRGGSWCTQPKDCRSGERRKYVPGDRPGLRGCRVVLCLGGPPP